MIELRDGRVGDYWLVEATSLRVRAETIHRSQQPSTVDTRAAGG